MMTRKFDWNRTKYENICPIVEHVLTFVTKLAAEDHEVRRFFHDSFLRISFLFLIKGIYVALRDLLDPTLPFYAKYCSQKVPTLSTIISIVLPLAGCILSLRFTIYSIIYWVIFLNW